MYARICRYGAVDWPLEELRRVGRQVSVALGTAPGFISYAVLDVGNHALASVCVFETRAQLEEGERVLQAWSSAHLGWPLGSPDATTTGEVIVQRGMCCAGSVPGRRRWFDGSAHGRPGEFAHLVNAIRRWSPRCQPTLRRC